MEAASLSKEPERIDKGIKISEEVSFKKLGLDANKYANIVIDNKSFFMVEKFWAIILSDE